MNIDAHILDALEFLLAHDTPDHSLPDTLYEQAQSMA